MLKLMNRAFYEDHLNVIYFRTKAETSAVLYNTINDLAQHEAPTIKDYFKEQEAKAKADREKYEDMDTKMITMNVFKRLTYKKGDIFKE